MQNASLSELILCLKDIHLYPHFFRKMIIFDDNDDDDDDDNDDDDGDNIPVKCTCVHTA